MSREEMRLTGYMGSFEWERNNWKVVLEDCALASISKFSLYLIEKTGPLFVRLMFVVLNIATQESWNNEKGDHENRTEWHRVYVRG